MKHKVSGTLFIEKVKDKIEKEDEMQKMNEINFYDLHKSSIKRPGGHKRRDADNSVSYGLLTKSKSTKYVAMYLGEFRLKEAGLRIGDSVRVVRNSDGMGSIKRVPKEQGFKINVNGKSSGKGRVDFKFVEGMPDYGERIYFNGIECFPDEIIFDWPLP